MDPNAFDRFTRLLGTPGSRRTALGVLIGSGVLSAAEAAFARKGRRRKSKGKDKQRTKAKKRRDAAKQDSGTEPTPDDGTVAVEATCGSPGPSSNLKDCNFNGADLDGYDLSSSNMKNTKFNGASLCGADLSSSTLTNADFRNANLTKADLHSSGCTGIKTNAATRFCQTKMCNGNVNNSDCPGAAPGSVCCAAGDCAERVCQAASCSDNGCEYADQDDGEAGTLCPDPRECCGGDCCPEGQKCCDGSCIPNASCCEADCAANEKCCGAACIADTICCTDGDPGVCPPNQQCCPGSDIPAVDDGGTCKQAIGQTCTDPNHPELDCCFPDFCCKNDIDDGPQCKAGSGKPCIGNDDCCNDAGLFCGTVGSNTVCCISQTGHACNPSVTPCCAPFVCDPDEFECVLPD